LFFYLMVCLKFVLVEYEFGGVLRDIVILKKYLIFKMKSIASIPNCSKKSCFSSRAWIFWRGVDLADALVAVICFLSIAAFQ